MLRRSDVTYAIFPAGCSLDKELIQQVENPNQVCGSLNDRLEIEKFKSGGQRIPDSFDYSHPSRELKPGEAE